MMRLAFLSLDSIRKEGGERLLNETWHSLITVIYIFKWLGASHLLPHPGLSEELMFNGKRNWDVFFWSLSLFLNNFFRNIFIFKSLLCYPSNSWLPFGKHQCISAYRESACYASCLKITMHNVGHAWRIYCCFYFSSSLLGAARRSCKSSQAVFHGPH